jgi:hypothetical protein
VLIINFYKFNDNMDNKMCSTCSKNSARNYFIGLIALFLALSGVLTFATISGSLPLANSGSNLAAVGAAVPVPQIDLEIKNVALVVDSKAKTPSFTMDICNNGSNSLANLSKTSIPFYATTYSTTTYNVSKSTSVNLNLLTAPLSAIGQLRSGTCYKHKFTLPSTLSAEYKVKPMISFAIDRSVIESNEANNTATYIDNVITPPVISEGTFRNSSYSCYDDSVFNEGGPTSCKTSSLWKSYADKTCLGKCSLVSGKCGVNSFGVSNACFATDSSSLSVVNTSNITVFPIDNGQRAVVAYGAGFSITLQNNSVNNAYVSAVTGDMFSTTSLANGSSATDATTTIISVMTDATLNGDHAGTSYVIPAGGTRIFNVSAHIGKYKNTTTSRTLTVTGVKYGPNSSGPYSSTITAGLQNLSKIVVFSGLD